MKIPILFLLAFAFVCPGQQVTTPEDRLKNVPAFLLPRCSKDRRLAAIKENGGDPSAEQAVIDALRFLKNTQHPKGYWSSERRRPLAMTSLGLLCFLGHGETTQSEEFGETVKKALNYLLISAVKKRGMMASDFNESS